MRAGEDESDSAISAIVLENTFRKHRPVTCATTDHAVESDIDAGVVLERVAGVHPPRVRTGWAPKAPEVIVVVLKVVVAAGIGPELRIVFIRAKDKWGAALPATDHLRAQQRFLLRT